MAPISSSLRFKFAGFAGLPSEPGHTFFSARLTDGRGNAWKLQLKPGGPPVRNHERPKDDPSVGLLLQNVGTKGVSAAYSIILRDADGRASRERHDETRLFEAGASRGFADFLKRSDVLGKGSNVLRRGALHVDVHLRFGPDGNSSLAPPSSLASRMLRLLESEEGADVRFRAGDATFPAHKVILRTSASVLFDFCEGNDDESPVAIDGTTPEIFRIVLRYIYGEELPDAETMTANAKSILEAADRFGLAGLKLPAESALVESLVMNMDNFADWLIFADSKTCPLLKECAMAYFADRSEDILRSSLLKRVEESPKLLLELMREMSRSSRGYRRFSSRDYVSVIDLRNQLRERGLEVDGSREMLVSRLRECRKRKRTDDDSS